MVYQIGKLCLYESDVSASLSLWKYTIKLHHNQRELIRRQSACVSADIQFCSLTIYKSHISPKDRIGGYVPTPFFPRALITYVFLWKDYTLGNLHETKPANIHLTCSYFKK